MRLEKEKDYWDAVAARDEAQRVVRKIMLKAFKVGDVVDFQKGMMCATPGRIEDIDDLGERLKIRNIQTDRTYWITTYDLSSRPGRKF